MGGGFNLGYWRLSELLGICVGMRHYGGSFHVFIGVEMVLALPAGRFFCRLFGCVCLYCGCRLGGSGRGCRSQARFH